MKDNPQHDKSTEKNAPGREHDNRQPDKGKNMWGPQDPSKRPTDPPDGGHKKDDSRTGS